MKRAASLAMLDDTLAARVLAESWEYPDADTQHLTHNIHRYSGKFIPPIAARAIGLLSRPGDRIVDPYCGSGTTLLEAALAGRRATGVDLNPLAVLIARVKTTPLPASKLQTMVRTLTRSLLSDGKASKCSAPEGEPRFLDPWYRKWFQEPVLRELLRIDTALLHLDDLALRDVGRVAFSDILRRSSNAHAKYPNVMLNKQAPEKEPPVRLFLKALERIVARVETLSGTNAAWSQVEVICGNAQALPMAANTVDAVLSHPPYVGSIPYAEYGALSLGWLGADAKQLDRELTGGRRQSRDVVQRFQDGYSRMLGECARVLKPGACMFLMVGNPVVKGELVDLAAMTLRLAEETGFAFVVRTDRKGVNRRANKMGAEHLLFFRKPAAERTL